MAYITVTEFKDSVYFGGLEDFFSNNTMISGFIDDVCSIIDNYIGRNLLSSSYSETWVGKNNQTYFVRAIPLSSITSITYQTYSNPGKPVGVLYSTDSSNPASTGVLSSGQYYSTNTGMIKTNSIFANNCLWTINYTAGYEIANLPRDVKTATLMLCRIMADSIDIGNLADPNGSTLNEFQFGKFRERYAAGSTGSPNNNGSNLPITITKILDKYKYPSS